ncbi:hypothetical protein [Enterovirga aerilata]|uniref:Uncharacterized protein n=1 Tax=Enterovirga aerilata TaxID=2730920 RepID=A0A849IDU8_9HYPH|nr:hypothetical protein [Enterovirga sp. DB1703]NNM74619.1 hypothetical protein [Enterovirga sp. DB1703]
MNLKLVLLVAGLLLGGLVGYLTRPEAAQLNLGPVSIEVQSDRAASPRDRGAMTTGQWQHVGAFAIGGAMIGLLAGFALDRRRR